MAASLLRRNPRIPIPLTRPYSAATSTSTSALKSTISASSDPDKIAELFANGAHHPSFNGDRQLYTLTVKKLSRARRPDLVERVLERQLSDPSAPKSEGFFARIVSLYSGAGMLDQALRTFDRIAPRTERSLCVLLTALLNHRQLDRLREAFNKAPAELGVSPGTISYNILIRALCIGGEVDAARQLLDEMPNKEVKPDIISYNTVLNGFLKKGEDFKFDEILKEIYDKGLSPSLVTYNCRIEALCRKGKSVEAEELLDVMASKGLQPSRLSFNTLIDGFSKEGDVGSAMRILERMKSGKRLDGSKGVSPNFETYNILLRTLVEKGEFSSALEICKECLVKKWPPPFQAVKGLIDGLTKNSQVGMAKDIAKMMKSVVSGDAADAWKKLEAEFSF